MRVVSDWILGHAKQLRSLVFRSAVERELAEELAFHVECEVEENIRRGMSPADARRAAHLAFGGVERYTEQVREARWTRWLDDLLRDVRHSIRSLSRSRAFAATVVLTLALGVGANAALYNLIEALAFRMPTGVPPSERLVRVHSSERWEDFSHPDLRDLQRATADAIELAGYDEAFVSLKGHGDAIRVGAQLVTAGYFDVLGMRPALGRWFMAGEDSVPGRDAVAVLSHAVWTTQFAADPGVLEEQVLINGHPFRIVGVAPLGFRGLSIEHPTEVWLPFMAQPLGIPREYDVLGSRVAASVSAVGRLRQDVTTSQVRALLSVSASRLPDAPRFFPVDPELTQLRGWIEPGSMLDGFALLGFALILTTLVLLICCANVTGLQVVRALSRSHELAVRTALGAGRGRLVRMMVTESVLLAFAAGAVGVLMAWGIAKAVQTGFAGESFDGPLDALVVAPDASSLLFTFALAAGAGMLFGLIPALRSSRVNGGTSMQASLRNRAGSSRLRSILVSGQVAAAIVLLVAAGMFLGRLHRIGDVDPGFDPDRYIAFSVDLHSQGYDEAARDDFFNRLRLRLERIPGVQAVAAPTYVPLSSGAALLGIEPVDNQTDRAGANLSARIPAATVGVAGNFFTTLRVAAVRGRTLREEDMRVSEKRVVISEPLALRLWGGEDPVGRSITLGSDVIVANGDTTRAPAHAVVVGTVRPIAFGQLADPTEEQVFVPANRHLVFADQGVLVRTAGIASKFLPAVRTEMERIAGTVPVFDLRVVATDVQRQFQVQRRLTQLIAAFGALALLLALVGLYGVIASSVAARTNEIGVRMALGASRHEITTLFVGGGVRFAVYGILAGSLAAVAVGRLISSLVWGIRPIEPLVMIATPLLLLVAAAAASWIPARRAARVNPMVVVREE